MAEAGEIRSPAIPQKRLKRSPQAETEESILSPRFRSAAAMAGWDEEALLFATLIVEDTPVRESSRQKRSRNQLKSSSSSSSNRKRRSRRQPVDSIPAVVLCLDDDDDEGFSQQEVEMKEKGSEGFAPKEGKEDRRGEETSAEINHKKGLPCMDKLREELSCAICLEICYEPSTTLCGHSFCKKCLKRAADKCGKKCPKCRELISNARSCTVNTVLWNTIQLLFPEEVESRKKAAALQSSSKEKKVPSHGSELERIRRHSRSRNIHNSTSDFRSAMEVLGTVEGNRNFMRRMRPSQSEDAALALRLQREEFLQTFRNSNGQQRNSLYTTRERLRSMALGVIRMRNRS